MNASTLPPRPWRLDRDALKRERRKHWALAIFLPLFGGAFVAYGAFVAVELVRERAIWADGREGQILSLDHTLKEERWPLVPLTVFEYQLSTRYLDAEGKLHEASAKLSRFGRLDPLRWTLKYDPQAPERIVFSGGVDSSAPWLGVLAALAFGLPLMAFGPHGLRAAMRRHADHRGGRARRRGATLRPGLCRGGRRRVRRRLPRRARERRPGPRSRGRRGSSPSRGGIASSRSSRPAERVARCCSRAISARSSSRRPGGPR